MPYWSHPGGLYDSGVFPSSQPQIDVSSIIGALSGGIEGIARAQIMRHIAQRQAEQRQWERGIRERELALQEQREQRAALTAGYTPAHDEFGTEQVPATIAPLNPNPAAVSPTGMPPAAGRPRASGTLPDIGVTPSAVPTPGPIQTAVSAPAAQHVDASYDPTKAEAYIRARDLAELHNEGLFTRTEATQRFQREQLDRRLTAQQAGREYAAGAARALYDYKRRNPMPRSGVRAAMTAGQEHSMHVSLALGFLKAHGGSLDQAFDTYRNTPEGQQLSQSGVSENDLLEASGKLRDDRTPEDILRVYNSGMVPSGSAGLDSAAAIVRGARAAAGASTGRGPRLRSPAPSTGSGRGASAGSSGESTAPPQTQDEYDYLIGSGMTDAQIVRRYGQPARGIRRRR